MRNKYSLDFEKEMIKKAPTTTLLGLLKIANKKYNYPITKKQLQSYLSKREIRYKDYKVCMTRNMGSDTPIGTEYTKEDGMVLVKVARNKWKYKQRKIYEDYYGVKLTNNDYIIFLNQDRTDFRIENLMRISRHESFIASTQKLFTKDRELTKLGVLSAKLMIKTKEKEKCLEN